MFRNSQIVTAAGPSPEAAELLALHGALVEPDGRAPFDALLAAARASCGPYLAALDPREDDYHYLFYGPASAAAAGFDMTGRLLSEVQGEIGRTLRALFDEARGTPCPVYCDQRASYAPNVASWERLILPCRTPEGGDRLLAFVKPRGFREDLLGTLLDTACVGVMSFRALRDAAGAIEDAEIVTVNRRAAQFTGRSIHGLVHARLLEAFPDLRGSPTWERFHRVMTAGGVEGFELRHDREGRPTWFRVTAAPVAGGFMISFADISDLKGAIAELERSRAELLAEMRAREVLERELRRLVVTDGLTGVLNRRGFDEAVRRAAAAARRYGHPLSVVAVDIDHFKRINDAHGHGAGDAVLLTVASLFAEAVRAGVDSVGRVGGEEFMILLPQTGLEGARALAERLRRILAGTPMPVEALRITASLGVGELRDPADPEAMLKEADHALYRAKRAGRDRVVAYPDPVETDLLAASA